MSGLSVLFLGRGRQLRPNEGSLIDGPKYIYVDCDKSADPHICCDFRSLTPDIALAANDWMQYDYVVVDVSTIKFLHTEFITDVLPQILNPKGRFIFEADMLQMSAPIVWDGADEIPMWVPGGLVCPMHYLSIFKDSDYKRITGIWMYRYGFLCASYKSQYPFYATKKTGNYYIARFK